MKLWTMVTVLLFLLGCSVKQAQAPSAPPQIDNKIFSAANFMGSYQSARPATLFLWPTERDGIPYTREQLVESRAQIVFLSEEITAGELKYQSLQAQFKKHRKEFKKAQCGQFQYCLVCEEGDENCIEDPDCEVDPDAGSVDEWRKPESPEEEKAIAWCQSSQNERKAVKKERNATQANNQILFDDFFAEIIPKNLRSLDQFKINLSEEGVHITLVNFEGLSFEVKPEGVFYDRQKGYISFEVPALKKNDEGFLVVFGEYRFSLEIGDIGSVVALSGELKFTDSQSGKSKTGRVSINVVLAN